MNTALHPYLKPYRQAFKLLSDPERAEGAAAYMRNQFKFYGIPKPDLQHTARELMRQRLPGIAELPDVVRSAWEQPQREFQYLAVWLVKAHRKDWDDSLVPLLEFMITHRSWWDSVDAMASDITGPFFGERRDLARKVGRRWNRSTNFWLQRSSLLFMKAWKKDMDKEMLTDHILHLAGSKEFFIQKAIGWVLRDHARVDPDWVRSFVREHEHRLAALSKREATKHIGY